MFMSIGLAAKGYVIMSITGVMAGAMFNFLLGLSLSFALKTIRLGSFNFALFMTGRGSTKANALTISIIIASICLFVFLFVRVRLNK